MLNSAPIAPKTEATLASLRKLHPKGENPAPVPRHDAPHFSQDVVRKSLSSFGPGSAAGLFGYKPFLLQQCVRAESFTFTRALTSAVNELAAGLAPSSDLLLEEFRLRWRSRRHRCDLLLVVTLCVW